MASSAVNEAGPYRLGGWLRENYKSFKAPFGLGLLASSRDRYHVEVSGEECRVRYRD